MNRIRKKKRLVAGGILSLVLAALFVYSAHRYFFGPEGQYFDSAGVRIHYTDEGHGTPVLLIHGFANRANLLWRSTGLINALSQEYRVIALDNRGHGRSGKSHDPDQYGMEMVEDVVRLLDHLKIEKTHVVGYSMGGFITLKLIATHPDRIISAAACGAGWERATDEQRNFAEAVASEVERGEADLLLRRLGFSDKAPSFLEKLGLKAYMAYLNDPRALAAVARGSVELTLGEAELRANQVPTLTIIGDQDGLLPNAQLLHARMANHELLVLAGKNHRTTKGSDAFLRGLLTFLHAHTQGQATHQA